MLSAEPLADALPQLLWIARLDGSVGFVNKAWAAFTGLPSQALLGWRWLNVLPAEDREAALAQWAHVRDVGRTARARLRIRCADGGYRAVQGQHFPMRDDSGRIACWAGWCVDLEELRAAEDPLRTLADSMPALIFTAGDDDRLLFVNEAWKEYTHLGIGSTIVERNALVHPDDLPRLEQALRIKAPGVEFRLRRVSDNEYRWHLLRWRRVISPSGTPLYRVGAIIDVHDRHVATEERERIAAEQRFLSELSRTINSTLDLETVVRHVETMAVPMICDRCVVELSERDSMLRRAEAAEGTAFIAVPLAVRGRTLGTMTFVRDDPRRQYSPDDLALLTEFARRAALSIDNARLFGREHRIADAMQSASLPKALPKIPSLDLCAMYLPGKAEAQIGGDWYDAFRLRDGRIVISVGDVTGSGIVAAVTMSNMRQVIRGTAQVHADPVLMLNAADRALRLEDDNHYVTAFVAVIDPIAQSILYANAGHPAPYVRAPGGSLRSLNFQDLPLGLRQKSIKRPKMDRLDEDSLLVFYTDGLIESEHDLLDGIARLERLLRSPEIGDAADPARILCDRMLVNGARDDVAVLTLRLRRYVADRASETTRHLYRWPVGDLNGDVASELRDRLRRVLQEHHYDAVVIERGELVLGELIGNVVRHAPGGLEVIVDASGSSPVLHVIDRGPGFERAPMLPADLMSESGRGLYIVSELTDEFSVTRGPEGGSHARAVLDG